MQELSSTPTDHVCKYSQKSQCVSVNQTDSSVNSNQEAIITKGMCSRRARQTRRRGDSHYWQHYWIMSLWEERGSYHCWRAHTVQKCTHACKSIPTGRCTTHTLCDITTCISNLWVEKKACLRRGMHNRSRKRTRKRIYSRAMMSAFVGWLAIWVSDFQSFSRPGKF